MKLTARLEIWKYKWERRKLDREKRRVDAEARQKKDPEIYHNWYAEHLWEFDLNEAGLREVITRETIRQAEKVDIPVPPQSDTDKWEEGIDNTRFLSREAVKELRAATRKARRQTIEWRVKVLVGILSAIAIVSALIPRIYKAVEEKSSTLPITVTPDQSPALKSHAETAIGTPLIANPLEIVNLNSSNDISVANNSLLPVYVIRLLVKIADPNETKSFGLDFDIDAGKTATHHIGDGFHNVRSLSLLGDTWNEHLKKATQLYQLCGIQLTFFSPSDPSFKQIKIAHSKNKRGLAYQDTTGVIYCRVRGLEGTSEQTVPIIVTTTVNGDACPRYNDLSNSN